MADLQILVGVYLGLDRLVTIHHELSGLLGVLGGNVQNGRFTILVIVRGIRIA